MASKDILKAEEIRSWAPSRLSETEGEIRRQIAQARMDLYQSPNAKGGAIRKLKTNLARIMTVKTEATRKSKSKKA
jgi:ribosomal protein L29